MLTPAEARVARVLSVPACAQLLELMREAAEPCTVARLAAAAGLRVRTARTHLESLVEVGLAERITEPAADDPPRPPGRPRVLYRPRPAGDRLGRCYQYLMAVLTEEMASADEPYQAAERAGRRWAYAIEQDDCPARTTDPAEALASLVRLLGRIGLSPCFDRIYIREFPLAEVARRSPVVLCGVIRGLLSGAIERLGAPLRVDEVDPFVDNEVCAIHVSRMDDAAAAEMEAIPPAADAAIAQRMPGL